MSTTIRKAALAATATLTLFSVVAPAEAARNDRSDLGGDHAWLTEMHAAIDRDIQAVKTIMVDPAWLADAGNQDKTAEATEDAASKAADAAKDADTAAEADAAAAKGASTEAERGLASKAGYAAVAAANKAVDASIAAASATIRIAKATGNTTAWTYANAAASKAVDASFAAANGAIKVANATGSPIAKQAAHTAAAAAKKANDLIIAIIIAANNPTVRTCGGHAGRAAIETALTYLPGTDKAGDSKSGETFRVKVTKVVQRSTQDVLNDPDGDPAEHFCKTIGTVGTHFVVVGGKVVVISILGSLGIPLWPF